MLALHILAVDRQRQVLRHDTVLVNHLHTRLLKRRAELRQRLVLIQLRAMRKATGPRKDRCDGVRARLFPLLIFAVMPGDGAVRGFGLDGLAVGCNELGGHHSKGAEALCEDVGLDVAIVVLACPDESTRGFDSLCDHVINQSVLVVDRGFVEEGFILTRTRRMSSRMGEYD